MTLRPVLFAAVTLGLLAVGTESMARPGQRDTAQGRMPASTVHAVMVPVRVQAVRSAAGGSSAMIVQTGAARRSAPVRAANANGIAGLDLARPAARGTVGGGAAASGGIDGGTVHRRH